MQLSLTNKADYAIRAVLDIARHHPELRTNAEMTEAMDLPSKFLSQILATLVRQELLESSAGPAGGYSLARPSAEISLLEIIEVIEGPITADECALGGGTCDWKTLCPLHETWSHAKGEFTKRLATLTFEDLALIDEAIRAGIYQPPEGAPPHPETPTRTGASDSANGS